MSWNKHIDQTSSKANGKLGFLRRNIKTKDQALKEKAYNTIVRPTVEYYKNKVWRAGLSWIFRARRLGGVICKPEGAA